MNKSNLTVLFDVDGLILDSELFYARAWADAFNANSPIQYQIDRETMIRWFFENLTGKKIGQQIENLQQIFKYNDIPTIYSEYRKLFSKRLLTDSIPVKKGFFELTDYLREKNVKLGIVTTSSIQTITPAFKNSNIDINIFDTIITGDLGFQLKPHPEPYLKACERLNSDKNKTIVFEDSSSGLNAAVNAGLKCFLIPDKAPLDEEDKNKAYIVCNSLKDAIPIIEKQFLNNKTL